jgi:hypothetical protein
MPVFEVFYQASDLPGLVVYQSGEMINNATGSRTRIQPKKGEQFSQINPDFILLPVKIDTKHLFTKMKNLSKLI